MPLNSRKPKRGHQLKHRCLSVKPWLSQRSFLRSIILTTLDSAHINDERNDLENARTVHAGSWPRGKWQMADPAGQESRHVMKGKHVNNTAKKRHSSPTLSTSHTIINSGVKNLRELLRTSPFDSSTHLSPRLHLLLRLPLRAHTRKHFRSVTLEVAEVVPALHLCFHSPLRYILQSFFYILQSYLLELLRQYFTFVFDHQNALFELF